MLNTSSTYNMSSMYSSHSLDNNTRVTCSPALSGHPSSSFFRFFWCVCHTNRETSVRPWQKMRFISFHFHITFNYMDNKVFPRCCNCLLAGIVHYPATDLLSKMSKGNHAMTLSHGCRQLPGCGAHWEKGRYLVMVPKTSGDV